MVSSNERLGNTLVATEVSWGVEGKSGNGRTAVCVEAILFTANVEEGPARGVAGSRCSCSVDLEEVCLVEGSGV